MKPRSIFCTFIELLTQNFVRTCSRNLSDPKTSMHGGDAPAGYSRVACWGHGRVRTRVASPRKHPPSQTEWLTDIVQVSPYSLLLACYHQTCLLENYCIQRYSTAWIPLSVIVVVLTELSHLRHNRNRKWHWQKLGAVISFLKDHIILI